jgi:hypothetical protein
MSGISPEKVLGQLKACASSRVSKSLEAVFIVCKEQQNRGLYDFSYSTIAMLGKGRGVPAVQSIRNKTGEVYQTLIKSFEPEGSDYTKKENYSSGKGKTYAWIDELDSPVVRLQANILYSQKKEAERLLQEVVPINQVIEVFDGGAALGSSVKLNELERSALEYLLSNEFLRRHKLEVGANGSILSTKSDESFFPVATLDAIKKALQFL